MSEQPTDDGDPQEVGYGRPPRRSQWKKGQSGNPRGRPRKRHLRPLYYGLNPAEQLLLEQDERRLKVRTPDGEVEMKRSEAVVERVIKGALGGDLKAAQFYLALVSQASQKSDKHKAELQRFAAAHVKEYGPRFELAEKQGRPPPDVLPHPSDIIVDENNDVIVVGPVHYWQQLEMEQNLAERDIRDEMLNRFHRNPGLPEEDHRSLMEKLRTDREKFNEKLPPRLQKPAPDDAP